jgi:hypothetical protein
MDPLKPLFLQTGHKNFIPTSAADTTGRLGQVGHNYSGLGGTCKRSIGSLGMYQTQNFNWDA